MQQAPDRPEKAKYPWYDLHSHFLPGIDDGCQTAEEAAQLLHSCYRQGLTGIVATPHYYPNESIRKFLRKRTAAEERLREVLESKQLPVPFWCNGAEAAYYEGLAQAEDLPLLCMGRSKFLLLELPARAWGNRVITDLYVIQNNYGITPIIAHLERYAKYQTRQQLAEVFRTGVLVQVNAGAILSKQKDAWKWAKQEEIHVLGSDCHNLHERKPNLMEAVRRMDKKGIPTEDIRRNNETVFLAAKTGSILDN